MEYEKRKSPSISRRLKMWNFGWNITRTYKPPPHRLKRGSTVDHAAYVGPEGSLSVDTDKQTAVVHNGIKAGGTPLATEAAVIDLAYKIDDLARFIDNQARRINDLEAVIEGDNVLLSDLSRRINDLMYRINDLENLNGRGLN
jgi:hypothetical protein